MSALDSFYNKVIMRIGTLAELLGMTTPLEPAEAAYITDEQTVYVGNGSSKPAKILTDKSVGAFDYTNADLITMPGGLVFDKTKPGQIGGVDLETINQQNGLIVRTGNNKFSSTEVASTDKSIVVTNGDGTLGNIDLALNLNNPALLNLINNNSFEIYGGTTPPTNATSGAIWWDSEEDIGYQLIGDSLTGSWIDFTS